jgi:hypothetical protein
MPIKPGAPTRLQRPPHRRQPPAHAIAAVAARKARGLRWKASAGTWGAARTQVNLRYICALTSRYAGW